MDWEVLVNIATFLTGLGVIGSFVVAMRSLRLDRKIYEATAARAERAAEVSDDNAKRVVDALWTIAEAGSVTGGPVTRQPEVEWSIEHSSGDRYKLTNVGSAVAIDVALSADDTLTGPSDYDGSLDYIRPSEAITFVAARSMETRDSTINVSWSTEGGSERYQWRRTLPARPAGTG